MMQAEEISALTARAATMLPPATVMMIECAGDRTGDPALLALLDEVQQKGLRGEPLCDRPCRTAVFSDRAVLVCDGCERMRELPHITAVGHGKTAAEAQQNAAYALSLPMDHPNLVLDGSIAAQQYGEGEEEARIEQCVFARAAYRSVDALSRYYREEE